MQGASLYVLKRQPREAAWGYFLTLLIFAERTSSDGQTWKINRAPTKTPTPVPTALTTRHLMAMARGTGIGAGPP